MIFMKTALRFLIPLATLATAAKAIPALSVSDGAELFATGTFGARYDDNVLLSEVGRRDTVYNLTPGVDFVYGVGSETKGHISYQESFDFYRQNPKLNTDLSALVLGAGYDDKKTKVTFAASWTQLANNTFSLRYPLLAANTPITRHLLIRRDQFSLSLAGETSVSEKSSLGSGVSYDYLNYKRAGFVDSRITTIPLDYYYQLSAKVDMTLALRYRDNNLRSVLDSHDYFVGLGARGSYTEKLHGSFAVGYTQRDYKSGGHANTVGANADVEYELTEKTRIRAALVNDFDNSGLGESQRHLTPSLGVTSKVANSWTLGATGSYHQLNYLGINGRTDNYLEASLEVGYAVTSNFSLDGSYAYRDLSSKLAGYDFSNSVISLSGRLRY
jgi:hypothetical protein